MIKRNQTILSLSALFLSILCILFYKCSPSIYWGDDGSLIVSSIFLTLGHPPGNPTYMLFERLSALMPFGDIAYKYNVLSAVLMASCIVIFLKKIVVEKFFKQVFIYTLVALIFVLSPIVVHQAVRGEVYALQMMFFVVAWSLSTSRASNKNILVVSFLAGLMMGVHTLIAVAVLPGLFAVQLFKNKQLSFRHIVVCFVLFVFGCSVFLYVPVRSRVNHELNWCDASKFDEFLSYATAKTYQKQFLTSEFINLFSIIKENIFKLFKSISIFLSIPILFLVIFSFGNLSVSMSEKVIIFLVTLMLTIATLICKTFSGQNWDFQGYLLISFTSLIILSGLGLVFLWGKNRILSLVLVSLILIDLVRVNLKHETIVSLHKDFSAREYAVSCLECLPSESIVLMKSDVLYILQYLEYIEHFRDKSEVQIMSRNRIYENIDSEEKILDWILGLVSEENPDNKNKICKKVVFWELADDDRFVFKYTKGLLGCYRILFHDIKISRGRCWNYFLKNKLNNNQFIYDINAVEQISMTFYNRGIFFLRDGQIKDAVHSFESAIKLNSKDARYYNNLGVALVRKGQLKDAVKAFRKALTLDPNHKNAYRNLKLLGEKSE